MQTASQLYQPRPSEAVNLTPTAAQLQATDQLVNLLLRLKAKPSRMVRLGDVPAPCKRVFSAAAGKGKRMDKALFSSIYPQLLDAIDES